MSKQTKGDCRLCGAKYTKTGMTKHISACADRQPTQPAGQTVFFITAFAGPYWVYFALPTVATLKDMDNFLRDLWLNCCGHLSQFIIEDERYDVQPDDTWGEKEKSMEYALQDVLQPGLEFRHEYDFGTTTELNLKVLEKGKIIVKGKYKPAYILAQNEPPEIICDKCAKQTATQICTECLCNGQGWLCSDCSKKHKCDEDMFLPVVNSPRSGMCGYTG